MDGNTPNIQPLPRIRRLPETVANQIAAGEVVERPASALKELVENALDAGASQIEIGLVDGGKTRLNVRDDGHGIAREDLASALERHATSKLDGDDLVNIAGFGFRGEALPSIGSVSRMSITSRPATAEAEAWTIEVAGGAVSPIRPATHPTGTTIDVRDLFYATPARLKFLRSDRAETQAILDTVRRLAMAAEDVGFLVRDLSDGADGRILFRVDPAPGLLSDARRARVDRIISGDFAENAVALDAEREGIHLSGFAGLPTFSRGSATAQYLFVNGRPVRDRLLAGAVRAAYSDVLSRDRHGVTALFIDCPPERVDVNVHPAKAEVRFREPGVVRGLIVSGIRHALAEAGHRSATPVRDMALGAFRSEEPPSRHLAPASRPRRSFPAPGLAETTMAFEPSARVDEPEADAPTEHPMGAARAQLHRTYILAQTESGVILVDQHAAHERLVYERLKAGLAAGTVARQGLLIPEIVDLGGDADRVLDHIDDLARLGLIIEPFGSGSVAVREIPALLGHGDVAGLLRDIADELADLGAQDRLEARLHAILSRMSCHGSVRAGRDMSVPEMNALLREMEAVPNSGTCNHGRPTWVALDRSDLERLFGRR